ncbi:hypothetical protein N8T08_008587 [Aspergillus melleus]|uniref:Uncharacterized protein n=1 Tax=Aspergillus melleus TaxID=138277 RepID=A0ACC3BEC5_9EURO|nr:hypothetical protein N8T08_008587 [Aspergillus melleus]
MLQQLNVRLDLAAIWSKRRIVLDSATRACSVLKSSGFVILAPFRRWYLKFQDLQGFSAEPLIDEFRHCYS